MDNTLPKRKLIRAKWHDYRDGIYFVTICTFDKKHYFGRVEGNEMHLSKIGSVAESELLKLSARYDNVKLVNHVVMPNHIHLIIDISAADGDDHKSVLATVVGGLKSGVSRIVHRYGIEFKWQPRFHDHIIRAPNVFDMIDRYINENPDRWNNDCYHGK